MFERLTARSPKNGMAYLVNVKQDEQDVESPYPNTLRCIMDSFNRLASYEDSGLSPEEVKQLIVSDESKEQSSIEWFNRAKELQDELNSYKQAKADGRLVVLPCKVGDELWLIRHGEIRRNYAYQWHLMNSPGQCFLSMYDDHCGLLDFGKTVFLTREAAEKAMVEVVG